MLRHLVRLLATALGLTLAALTAIAPPVAAAQPDGAYARFSIRGGTHGLTVVSYTGATHVNAGFVGLLASHEYFLTGRSIGCGGHPSASNLLFSLGGMSTAQGGFTANGDIGSPGSPLGLKSLWLGPKDRSQPPACAPVVNFERLTISLGDVNGDGDGAVGLMDGSSNTIMLVERRGHGRARVSIVVNGLNGNDTLVVRGVDTACGTPAHHSYISTKLSDIFISSFRSTRVSLTQKHLDALRSFRIRGLSQGPLGCGPLQIIGVLIA
jgi:hypothetical protein